MAFFAVTYWIIAILNCTFVNNVKFKIILHQPTSKIIKSIFKLASKESIWRATESCVLFWFFQLCLQSLFDEYSNQTWEDILHHYTCLRRKSPSLYSLHIFVINMLHLFAKCLCYSRRTWFDIKEVIYSHFSCLSKNNRRWYLLLRVLRNKKYLEMILKCITVLLISLLHH